MSKGIDMGTALALMKSISGAVDVSAAETARDGAETAQTAAETASSDAEAFAAGTRNGVAVGATDDAYHNNAAYYAGLAQERSYAVTESGTALVFTSTSNG